VASNESLWYWPYAADGEVEFEFRIRYRNGTEYGPYSTNYYMGISV
jgi:hypothetical protein